ncbi:hypothetical protein [Flavobacterium succinicans]|uniref:Lipoprotein n=1 Tax=Flavobacterium succinicans TaxID=29536 RepID=A0A199XN66_9FLAO|nr:hypothetical protein [Flavobacterium succinicans]OAZ02799.1 hypothetical protein FLB_27730 [Flavobacterium succinicans]
MKSLYQFLVLSLVLLATSCTVTENIYVNADGSGKFNVDLDGSSLMAMMPKDSLKAEKNVDSTFAFKQILADNKDTIAKLPIDQQQLLKKLENFNMRMQMNQEQKKFLFSLQTNFKNVSELQDAMTAINAMSLLQNKANKATEFGSAIPSEGLANNNSTLSYAFKGNKFTRTAILKNTKKETLNEEAAEMNKMIFASSNYIIKYHFAKPVKKVSNSSALFSEDRKTVTLQYPFSEYMENPEKLNLEVEF